MLTSQICSYAATFPSAVSRLRSRFAGSIASRTIAATTLALTSVMSLLVVGAAAYMLRDADSTVERRAEAILAVITATAEGPLWDLDRTAADAMMAGLKGEREVVLAELLDDAGASFASYGTRAPDRADALTTIISNVTRRSGGGDRVIGVMRLTFTTAYAHAEAWRAIHALVASSLAATLAMALCLARMMRRLTVPMTELVRVVNAFQGGQLDASVGSPTDRSDELGAVARSLNSTLTDLRTLNTELAARHERFDVALNTMAQGLCMLDADMRMIVCNGQFMRMFDLTPEDTDQGAVWSDVAMRIADANEPGEHDFARFTKIDDTDLDECRPVRFLQAMPHDRFISVSYRRTPSGGVVSTYEDVSDRQRNEARIVHMAGHDALTDLPNRVLLGEHLDRALSETERGGAHLALLYLDLDRFKSVNDTLGHPTGDKLLVQVAKRLRSEVHAKDIVARLGGDEFAVVKLCDGGAEGASDLAERLLTSLSRPYEIDGSQIDIGVSIGIAMAPADAIVSDQLAKRADLALYCAKADGRGVFRFFETDMDLLAQARRQLEVDLRQALARGELELFFQPLVDVLGGRVKGFETLLRWRHPVRGLVSPADFIPLAEELDLITPIGAWVIEEACREAMGWADPNMRVAVNVSPIQFRPRTLAGVVAAALARSGLEASRLELEITEAVFMAESKHALETLHDLRGMGVRIAMDDFGTGYSSLGYLRDFPFDKIKIDQSFVKGLGRDAGCYAIVAAVASLGAALGITTTVEGVETAEQFGLVEAAGCTEVQGYIVSRPRPAYEIEPWLIQHSDPGTSDPWRCPSSSRSGRRS